MSKVFDLSEYLEEKKSKIVIGEQEFEVKDGFNDLLKVDALTSKRDDMGSTEFVQEFLNIALGKEQAGILIAMNLPVAAYMKIMNCIQEVYSGSIEGDANSQAPTLV